MLYGYHTSVNFAQKNDLISIMCCFWMTLSWKIALQNTQCWILNTVLVLLNGPNLIQPISKTIISNQNVILIISQIYWMISEVKTYSCFLLIELNVSSSTVYRINMHSIRQSDSCNHRNVRCINVLENNLFLIDQSDSTVISLKRSLCFD